MKFRHALVIPVTAALVAATAFAASAAVVVPPTPFATLPMGSVPVDVVTDAAHNVYALNRAQSTVTEYTSAGTLVHTYSFPGSSGAVVDMTIDANGTIYTANAGDNTIGRINTVAQTLDPAWADIGAGHKISVVQFDDAGGFLYAADRNDGALFRIDSAGGSVAPYAVFSVFGSTTGLTISPDGNIFASWNDTGSIGHIAMVHPRPAPAFPIVLGTYALTGADADTSGIVSNSAGDLYVTNTKANTVMEFDTNHIVSVLLRTWSLLAGTDPIGIAIDRSHNVYFSGTNTVTGESSIGFISSAGDLLPSPLASLPTDTNPLGLTIDNVDATLFAAGSGNATVVRLSLGATITSADPSATLAAGAAFSYTPTTAGIDPITFSSPNLPAGFTLDAATGAVTGAAGAAGSTIAFDLVPSNTFGAGTAQHIVITVAAAPPAPTPTPTPTSGTGGPGSSGGASTSTSGTHLPTVAG